MSIKISIGVAEDADDWDLLEQCRNTPRSVLSDLELESLSAGWPQPSDRADDESEESRPAWAW